MGCQRPAQLTLAETRPPRKCKCPSFGARGLGWVRFPALKNVSRQWVHSCCQFTTSRKRQRDNEGCGEGEARGGEGSGGRARAPRLLGPVFHALGAQGAQDLRLERTETCLPGETEAAAGKAGGGGANVGKRNRGSQKTCKTKGGTIWRRRRRSLVSTLCRRESWLWISLRVYCVGSQAESGGLRKRGGGRAHGGREVSAEKAAPGWEMSPRKSAVASNKR